MRAERSHCPHPASISSFLAESSAPGFHFPIILGGASFLEKGCDGLGRKVVFRDEGFHLPLPWPIALSPQSLLRGPPRSGGACSPGSRKSPGSPPLRHVLYDVPSCAAITQILGIPVRRSRHLRGLGSCSPSVRQRVPDTTASGFGSRDTTVGGGWGLQHYLPHFPIPKIRIPGGPSLGSSLHLALLPHTFPGRLNVLMLDGVSPTLFMSLSLDDEFISMFLRNPSPWPPVGARPLGSPLSDDSPIQQMATLPCRLLCGKNSKTER